MLAILGAFSTEARADGADANALREQCTKAMNADAGFAKSIVIVAENQYRKARLEQINAETITIAAHSNEEKVFAKNQRHVYLAYAAMWVLAAGFLMLLWRRQQRLVAEIGQLHRELAEATAAPAPAAKPAAKKPETKKAEPKPETKKADAKPEAKKVDKADEDDAGKDPVTKDDD